MSSDRYVIPGRARDPARLGAVWISQLDNHCCDMTVGLLRSPTTASISRTHSQCQREACASYPRPRPRNGFLHLWKNAAEDRPPSCDEASEGILHSSRKRAAQDGGASRDRTDDLKLAKLALSQLSYGPTSRMFANVRSDEQEPQCWWAEKELNLRPHAYQACALTT